MPYCENCGSQVDPNAKFCGNCGAVRNQPATTNPTVNPQPVQQNYSSPTPSQVPPPPPPPPVMQAPPIYASPAAQPVMTAPQASGETIVGIIAFRKMKSLGRYDAYTGVVTSQRVIFAQLTTAMVNDAVQQARDQAKAEGKGFWGQWSNQLQASFNYMKKYGKMQPESILGETPGNFALNNDTIREVKVKLKGDHDENQARREFEVQFHSSYGKYEFRMNEDSNYTNLLKRVYGDRVKMPFGYFNKGIRIGF